ncbi:hypothetical protein ACJWSQ_21905, partial [Klebsiella pneumoniae]
MKDKNFSRSISLQCPTCGTTTLLNDQDIEQVRCAREGANKQVISSQADSLIKISRIWADF